MVDMMMPNLLMDILAWDTPVWGYLISVFTDFIGNFGWTIIVFTLLLKIILIPLDYFQRKNAKRNAELQKIMKPELDKVKQKYANVSPAIMQQKLQEKQVEIYKRNNVNVIGSCLVMFFNMAITIVVFLTLFNALNYIANIQITNMYTTLSNEYIRVYDATEGDEAEKKAKAEEAVVALYDGGDVVQSWLWVKNVWRGDKSVSAIPSYKEFISQSKYSSDESQTDVYLSEQDYLKVMQPVMDKENGWNGYYILIALAGIITYLSTVVSSGGFRKKKDLGDDPTAKITGVLKFILPAIMILFTLFSNAVFSLYVIANSLFALCTTPIYNKIFKRKEEQNGGSFGGGFGGSKGNANELEVDYRIQKNTIIKD